MGDKNDGATVVCRETEQVAAGDGGGL